MFYQLLKLLKEPRWIYSIYINFDKILNGRKCIIPSVLVLIKTVWGKGDDINLSDRRTKASWNKIQQKTGVSLHQPEWNNLVKKICWDCEHWYNVLSDFDVRMKR